MPSFTKETSSLSVTMPRVTKKVSKIKKNYIVWISKVNGYLHLFIHGYPISRYMDEWISMDK